MKDREFYLKKKVICADAEMISLKLSIFSVENKLNEDDWDIINNAVLTLLHIVNEFEDDED